MRQIKKAAASQTVYLEILDSTSTTGARKTGLVFNTASLTAYYVRSASSAVAITLATLAAANTAWSSGGFKEVDATNMPGVYRLDVPDAAFASGAESVVITVRGATGMAQVSLEVQLVDNTPADVYSRVGAPAGASVSADVAAVKAVLPSALVSGRIDASVGAMASGVLTATAIASDAITAAKIADGAIDAATFAASAITATVIAADAITAAKIADGAIDAATFAAGAINAAAIAADAITAAKIADGAIDAATFAAGAINAAAIATDAITDAKVASDVTIASVTGAVGSVTGNVGGNVTGSVGSIATGGIAAASFAAGAIDNAAIATDAIGSAELATSAVTEIQSGLSTLDAAGVRSAVGLASANLDTQLSGISGYIDTEVASIKSVTDKIDPMLVTGVSPDVYRFTANALSLGPDTNLDAAGVRAAVGLASANLDTQLDALPTNAELTTALGTADDAVLAAIAALNNLSQANVRTAVGLGSANLDTQLDALPTNAELATALGTADDATLAAIATLQTYVDTEVAAIKSVTDKIDPMLVTGVSPDVYRYTANALSLAPTGGTAPTAAEVADAVWDEVRADHATSGSFGQGAASVQGNVTGSVASIATGGIVAGSFAAGAIDNAAIATDAIGSAELASSAVTEIQSGLSTLDAAGIRTAVGLATANLDTQLSTIDDFLDTEVAAIKAKTDNLPSDPADASDIASSFSTVNATLATIAGYIDTEVAAIKAKTDNLPSDPADASDIAGLFTTLTGKVDVIDDFLDTEVAAIKAKTDLIPAAPAAVGDIPTANANADALLDRTAGVETGLTVRQQMRLSASALFGKASGLGTTTAVFRDFADTKPRLTATVDDFGNRPSVTRDAT